MKEITPKVIWQALDDLRANSPLTSREFGQGFAALLFLRWADFQDAEQEAVAAFEDEVYQPVLSNKFHWRHWHQLSDVDLIRVVRELPNVVREASSWREGTLAAQLYRIVDAIKILAEFPSDTLTSLVRWLADQPFETPDDRRALRDIFSDAMFRLTDKQAAQFFTPQHIVDFVVDIARPQFEESIYDPCFGSGGFLTAAVDYVREHDETNVRSGKPPVRLSGVEWSKDAYVIGLVRMVLSGTESPRLELGDSLERDFPSSPSTEGFDLVMMNPPWGKIGSRGLDHYAIPTNNTTSLFIQHALSQLKPDGRAVFIVPQGILFSGGPERELREMLLRQHTVESIVALPAGSFMPFTSVNSSIVSVRKGKPTKSVRMIDLSGIGHRKPKNLEGMTGLIAKMLDSDDQHEYAWDVDIESLEEVDFDLTPRRRDQGGLEKLLNSFPEECELRTLDEVATIRSGRSVRSDQLLDSVPKLQARSPKEIVSEMNSLKQELRELERSTETDFQHVGDVHFQLDSLADELDASEESAPSPVPYIRIRDINQGQTLPGSSWLSEQAILKLDPKRKLRLGDLLISKSGTIGKTGIVRNGAVGGVAASGFFVLRAKEFVDPHFLLAYLNSNECRQWLDNRSRGTAARHLSMKSIKELPVPVPPLQIQKHVVAQHREQGTDALEILNRLLTGAETNKVAEWLTENWQWLSSASEAGLNNIRSSAWERIANELRGLRNEAAHSRDDAGVLLPWLLATNEAMKPLREAEKIPDQSAMWSVFNEAMQRAKNASQRASGESPDQRRARQFTDLLAAWLEEKIEVMATDSELVFSCDKSELVAGEPFDLLVTATSKGPLPLRYLRFTTEPDFGEQRVDFLASGKSCEVVFSVDSNSLELGPFNLNIHWEAMTIDGTSVESTTPSQIGFNVVAASSKTASVDLGGSPYVCGDPVTVDRNDVFFGREELIEQIKRQIIQSGNVVLLEGNRRAGKSSILWHLEGKDAIPGWLGIYCSLQGTDGAQEGGIPTAEVFRSIAYDIVQGIRKLNGKALLPDGTILDSERKLGVSKSVRAGISDDAPFQDFREYLELVMESLAEQNLGLLLMMDEFDKLQEGINNGVTSPQTPENIRFLVQSFPRFSAILTGSRRLKKMREEYWSALFGLGTKFDVSVLPEAAAERLILEPVKDKISFSTSATKLACQISARQPYLLQCLCNRIFDIAATTDVRSITVVHVQEAAAKLVRDNEHFASLWDYTEFERRRFLLYLLHREESGPDQMRLPVIEEKLRQLGIELHPEVLMSDLEYLIELELVDLHGEESGAYYTLTIPMMGDWLDGQHDFNMVLQRARAEAEDISGKVNELRNLQKEIHKLESDRVDGEN